MRSHVETYIGAATVSMVILWIMFGLQQTDIIHDDDRTIHVDNFTILKPRERRDIDCVKTKTKLTFTLCPLPHDRSYVSTLYRKSRLFDSQISRTMEKALDNYPRATVIDVGVHDGYFSMLAATRGHQVLAVESSKHVASYLRHSLHVDKPTGHVTLLYHSLADHGLVTLSAKARMHSHFSRVKTMDAKPIFLDELIPYIKANPVIMKIDVDGRECKAWTRSKSFFTKRSVPYIFVAWKKMVVDAKNPSSACNHKTFTRLIKYFTTNNYSTFDVEQLHRPTNASKPVQYMLLKHKNSKRLL